MPVLTVAIPQIFSLDKILWVLGATGAMCTIHRMTPVLGALQGCSSVSPQEEGAGRGDPGAPLEHLMPMGPLSRVLHRRDPASFLLQEQKGDVAQGNNHHS